MPLYLTSATNKPVTLQEIIASRDARWARQRAALAEHVTTLVSFTVVIPGPVKDSLLTRQIFNRGLRQFRRMAEASGWEIVKQSCFPLVTGPECLAAINAPAHAVKRATVELEQASPLGRLWDLDVFTPQGELLSRSDFDLPARKCLVCDREAAYCAHEKTHSVPTLIACMEALLNADDSTI